MKLNKKGWGYQMMFTLMGLIIFALLIASYYIYKYYNELENLSNVKEVVIKETVK